MKYGGKEREGEGRKGKEKGKRRSWDVEGSERSIRYANQNPEGVQ